MVIKAESLLSKSPVQPVVHLQDPPTPPQATLRRISIKTFSDTKMPITSNLHQHCKEEQSGLSQNQDVVVIAIQSW